MNRTVRHCQWSQAQACSLWILMMYSWSWSFSREQNHTSTIPSPEWSDLGPTAVRITKLIRLGWIRECLKAEWRCGCAICRCVVLISSVFISSVPAEMETFQHVGSHSVLNACANQVHLSVQNSCFEFALAMPLIVCCTEGHVKALMTLTFCKNYC